MTSVKIITDVRETVFRSSQLLTAKRIEAKRLEAVRKGNWWAHESLENMFLFIPET